MDDAPVFWTYPEELMWMCIQLATVSFADEDPPATDGRIKKRATMFYELVMSAERPALGVIQGGKDA